MNRRKFMAIDSCDDTLPVKLRKPGKSPQSVLLGRRGLRGWPRRRFLDPVYTPGTPFFQNLEVPGRRACLCLRERRGGFASFISVPLPPAQARREGSSCSTWGGAFGQKNPQALPAKQVDPYYPTLGGSASLPMNKEFLGGDILSPPKSRQGHTAARRQRVPPGAGRRLRNIHLGPLLPAPAAGMSVATIRVPYLPRQR